MVSKRGFVYALYIRSPSFGWHFLSDKYRLLPPAGLESYFLSRTVRCSLCGVFMCNILVQAQRRLVFLCCKQNFVLARLAYSLQSLCYISVTLCTATRASRSVDRRRNKWHWTGWLLARAGYVPPVASHVFMVYVLLCWGVFFLFSDCTPNGA